METIKIRVLEKGTVKTVRVEGRMSTLTSSSVSDAIAPLLVDGEVCILDCKKLEYISSSGLRVILDAHKTMAAKGGKFILKNLSKEVRSVIDLTGFSKFLTIE